MNKVFCPVCALVLVILLLISASAATGVANQPTVTLRMTNSKTGYVMYKGTFTVVDDNLVEVPSDQLKLVESAFGTTTFGPGTHTKETDIRLLTIEVPEGLTVTFVDWARRLSMSR